MLDIEQDQIRADHEPVQFLHIGGICLLECDAGGIDAGVDVFLFRLFKQLQKEIQLQHGFSAGGGDAAGTVIRPVALKFGNQLIRAVFCTESGIPGVRIVTVLAAHRTSLKKDDKTDARPVHGSK